MDAFVGRKHLRADHGWQYHRARSLDPRAGRFVGMDPFGGQRADPTTLHRYLYAAANPGNRADPTGLFTLTQTFAVSAMIGALAGAALGAIRGGTEGAVVGALAGAIGGPIATGIVLTTGYAIAYLAGVSAVTGQAIAGAGFGVLFGADDVREIFTANDLNDRIAAAVSLSFTVTTAMLGATYREPPLIIRLRYKPTWTPAQIAAADHKVALLNQAGGLMKTEPVRSGTSASQRYRQAGNQVPCGCDVDHVRDLQLRGADVLSNMAPLDRSVNRSLGAQVYNALRDWPEGTSVGGFVIGH